MPRYRKENKNTNPVAGYGEVLSELNVTRTPFTDQFFSLVDPDLSGVLTFDQFFR